LANENGKRINMKILLKLFSIKLLATILGVTYSILQVKYFGATRTIEIFFAAQSLIYLVTSLTQGGQLAEVFLPVFHQLNHKKEKLGYTGLNVIINRMLLFGTILIAIVFIFAPFFIQLLVPGFSEKDKEFATLIFRILLPYLYLQIFNSFFITVLNAEKKFGRAEFLSLTNTIINIASLIILYPYIKIWALVISLLLGKIVEFLFYITQLYKNQYRYKFILSIAEFDHKEFFKTMQSTLLYVGSTQIFSIVLTASISFLPEGTFAIFKYVQNLSNKVRSLFVQPFLTIFFTNYSLLLQKLKSVNKEFSKNVTSIFNINIIVLIGTILMGDLILDFIWGGKKFSHQDVKLAYIFLIFNILGVFISSISSIYRKMAVAHNKAKKLYFFWAFSQLLSAGITYLLIRNFKINGLLLIIPINTMLLGSVSYLIYKQTKNKLTYPFINKQNLINFSLIVFAILVKSNWTNYFNNKIENVIFLSLIVLLFSLYPMYTTYNILKK